MANKANKVLIFSFSQVINLVINFFVSPYLARALPKTDYSAFNQVIVIIGLISVLFSVGFQAVVFFFLSSKSERKKQIINTLQFLILAAGLLSAMGLLVVSFLPAHFFNNPEILVYIRICSLSVLFTFINNYLISILLYNDRAKLVAFTTIFTSIFSLGFIYISLNIWGSIKSALLFSQVLTPLLSGLILSFPVRRYFIYGLNPDRQSARSIFKISLPLYFTSMLGSSYIYISSFFVIFLLGDVAYANYRNGAVEIPFISTIAFSVSAVLLPDLNKLFQEGKKGEALELKKKIINQCIFLLYPVIIFFIVYHYEFIVSYFSEKYAESAIVFAIYSCTCFVRINDYQDVLITAGKSGYILKANVLYFLINICLVVALGLLFGITGVAIAASVSVFALALILLRKDASIFNISIIEFFRIKEIAILMLLAFTVSIVLKICLEYFFNTGSIAAFLIAASCYFPIVYLYILRKGYIIASVVDMLRRKVPFFKLLLPNK
jgi:O-antigen/teichoic acid export membrane protein